VQWKARNKVCFQKKLMENPINILFSVCAFIWYWVDLYHEETQQLIKDGVEVIMNTTLKLIGEQEDRKHVPVLEGNDTKPKEDQEKEAQPVLVENWRLGDGHNNKSCGALKYPEELRWMHACMLRLSPLCCIAYQGTGRSHEEKNWGKNRWWPPTERTSPRAAEARLVPLPASNSEKWNTVKTTSIETTWSTGPQIESNTWGGALEEDPWIGGGEGAAQVGDF
jgi:hypothetical protein